MTDDSKATYKESDSWFGRIYGMKTESGLDNGIVRRVNKQGQVNEYTVKDNVFTGLFR